jgi:hypothetical protein
LRPAKGEERARRLERLQEALVNASSGGLQNLYGLSLDAKVIEARECLRSCSVSTGESEAMAKRLLCSYEPVTTSRSLVSKVRSWVRHQDVGTYGVRDGTRHSISKWPDPWPRALQTLSRGSPYPKPESRPFKQATSPGTYTERRLYSKMFVSRFSNNSLKAYQCQHGRAQDTASTSWQTDKWDDSSRSWRFCAKFSNREEHRSIQRFVYAEFDRILTEFTEPGNITCILEERARGAYELDQ